MRYIIVVLAIFLTVGLAATAQQAQTPAQVQPNGSAIFDRSCASCHRAGEKEVPAPELLRTLTPEAIVNALAIGKDEHPGRGSLHCRTRGSRNVPDGPGACSRSRRQSTHESLHCTHAD